jgi:hypothetical protein
VEEEEELAIAVVISQSSYEQEAAARQGQRSLPVAVPVQMTAPAVRVALSQV